MAPNLGSYTGLVRAGGQKARALGYPTINIPFTDAEPSGIYAGEVLLEGARYGAVIYADQVRGVLEAYLFDFADDAYGKAASITLLTKIREDATFSNDQELHRAIEDDTKKAREYLRERM